MDAAEIQKIVCRQCFALLDAADNFCRHCGTPTAEKGTVGKWGPSPFPRPAVAVTPSKGEESFWLVLIMLFVVLGPLALPMLWRSRHISRLWKTVLTVLVVLLTALVLGLIWYVLDKTVVGPLRQLDEFQRSRGF